MADAVLDSAKVLKSGQKTEVELQLKPEWLGNISLKISSQDGKINVQIFAGQASKELLESQMAELEITLKNANIAVGSLTVFVGGQNTGGGSDRQLPQDSEQTAGILPLTSTGNALMMNVVAARKENVLSALGLSGSALSKEI